MNKLMTLLSISAVALLILSCTKDSGTVTVNYQEAIAIYGNLDDTRTIDLNQSARQIINAGKIFIAEDFILIGEEGEGIHVINNRDKQNPINESFVAIPGNREFVVYDNILYAESYYDMLKIDIASPTKAELVERSEFAIQQKFVNDKDQTLIGFSYENKTIELTEDDDFYEEIIGDQLVYLDYANNIIPNSAVPSSFAGNSNNSFGTVNRIAKVGDYVYVVSKNNMIIMDDNQFESTPKVIKNLKENMETIFPYEDKLFVGTRTSMDVYSMVDPSQPNAIFEFEHATSCDPVLAKDGVAYVTLRTGDFAECPGNTNALVVVDVEDLSNAKVAEEILMTSPYGMTIVENKLYVGEGQNGYSVYDITDERSPELILHDPVIHAYDIIADPNDANLLFFAGPNGLTQFIINEDQVLDMQSQLSF